MKTYNPDSASAQQKMLDRFFRYHTDCWSQYRDKARLIWEGEHYVLIRTGMSESKSRYVWMADKAGLLAPDDDDSPLAQLAGSLTHPVQRDRANEKAEILHDSDQSESNEGMFKGRWCKARKAQCIAYAEQREASYEHELPGWIEEHERLQAESEEFEREERRFSARLVRFARKRLPHRAVRMDCRYDNGTYGTRTVSLGENLGGLTFEARPDTWRVEVSSHYQNRLSLSESQFQRFLNLLAQFAAEEERTKDELGEQGLVE